MCGVTVVLQDIKTGYGVCVAAVSRFALLLISTNKDTANADKMQLRLIQQSLHEVIHHTIPKYTAQLEKEVEEIYSLIDSSIAHSLRNGTELEKNCVSEKEKLLHILKQVKQLNLNLLNQNIYNQQTSQLDTDFNKFYQILEKRIGIIEELIQITKRLKNLDNNLQLLRKNKYHTCAQLTYVDSAKIAINQAFIKITDPIKTISSPSQRKSLDSIKANILARENNDEDRATPGMPVTEIISLSNSFDVISAKILQTLLILEQDKDIVFKISELIILLGSQVTDQFTKLREIDQRAKNLSASYAKKTAIGSKQAEITLDEIHQLNRLISSLSLKLPFSLNL
jgi:hypothetical protein